MAELSRRRLLSAGAVVLGGTGLAWGAREVTLDKEQQAAVPSVPTESEVEPFYGTHQAGIATAPQAHSTFVALDLRPEVDRAALIRLLKVWTEDAARLTEGRAALADTEPDLATEPTRLTVTVGFGPGVFRLGDVEHLRPAWLRPLPPFAVDKLEDRWSGGDLLLQVGAEDPVTVAHALRVLLKGSAGFSSVRWTQRGFRRARGTQAPGTTMRNLFGQVDGTVNPSPGTADFADLVWDTGSGQAWMAGGTSVVIRRTHLDLDEWDKVDRPGREQSVGRRLSDGAPLTGDSEHDEPDFAAMGATGFPVIPEFSHIARARSADPRQRIHRRGYNYDEAPAGGEISDSGLIFVCYQADVDAQFVPIQQRLSELDMLNQWTTPIGSAVFAIPPGCAKGGYIGQQLFGG
ncbi:dyp-type peroxidase family protein [Rhodococcus sp. MTM3W5.2]|uniref:Dyp-type peroxidase n=1 Tax=Rhodococcus sp. MTM3W5.2 TaxID=1805827 RepID=UPI0009793D22|nr:Dyp-type peroxidase [Rhodococcus sp. MTM3W5.2]AQA25387.1 dyp-type peroxidase family protein [Rhodococcus sp. MTM3W5.2]